MTDPTHSNRDENAESPCVNVCVIGTQGICMGCFRTLDEIGAWSRLADSQRIAINRECKKRQEANSA